MTAMLYLLLILGFESLPCYWESFHRLRVIVKAVFIVISVSLCCNLHGGILKTFWGSLFVLSFQQIFMFHLSFKFCLLPLHFFGFFLICSDCVFGNILDVFHEFLPAFCMQLVSPTTVAHWLIFNSFSHFIFLSKTFCFIHLYLWFYAVKNK